MRRSRTRLDTLRSVIRSYSATSLVVSSARPAIMSAMLFHPKPCLVCLAQV